MFKREILQPDDCRKLGAGSHGPVWVYRYKSSKHPWTLCVGTQAEPKSGKLSLGGFRIVPAERAALPGFDPAKEAVGLACGMSEKVYWSKVAKVGGPLGLQNLERITGGKCVLLPSAGARVGEAGDIELLEFALSCLKDMEEVSGAYLVTGQDLGHGMMSDKKNSSLQYMADRFRGCVVADTGKPTGSGNFYVLKGMLGALGLSLADSKIGFIGAGNVGRYVLDQARLHGAAISAVEPNAKVREQLSALGVEVAETSTKQSLLASEIDALVLNANGGSLDDQSIEKIIANQRIKIICGSENLVCPNPDGPMRLQAAGKHFAPTELCGMMGYLTAVEEYLSRAAGTALSMDALFEASKKLEEVGKRIITGEFSLEY